MEIFKLVGSIFLNDGDVETKIEGITKKADGLASKLGQGIKTAAKWGAGLAAGAGAAVTGMLALASKTAATADQIDKMSIRTGISREQLQELKYVTGQVGVSFESIESAVARMTRSMDAAREGSGRAGQVFEALGIQIKNTDGSLRSTNDVFNETILALASMENESERNALAMEIFGRGATELIPLFDAGADGIQELANKAHELGLVMSDEAIAANVKFADTLDSVKQATGAVFQKIGTQLLPILMTFLNWVLDHMPEIQAVFSTVFKVIGTLVQGFVKGIELVVHWLGFWYTTNEETVSGISQRFKGFFEAVMGFLQSFITFFTNVWQQYGDDITAIIEGVWSVIGTIVSTALDAITSVFNIFAALFKGDWEGLWNGVKDLVGGIWEGIKSLVSDTMDLLVNIIRGFVPMMLDAGRAVFQGVWDGLKSVWSGIATWVSEKIAWLKDKLMFWRKSQSEMSAAPTTTNSGTESEPIQNMRRGSSGIPMLAEGGVITRAGTVLVGERGPELLELPRGAKVTPLSHSSMARTANIIVELDGRTLARAMGQPLVDEIRVRTGLKL